MSDTGGSCELSPLHVGSPWATALAKFDCGWIMSGRVASCGLHVEGAWYDLCGLVVGNVSWAGEELSSTFWGKRVVFALCLSLRYRGRFPWWGGGLVPFGTTVPWGVSSEGQGGPWAPPPCGEQIPWDFVGFLLGSVFGPWFWWRFVVLAFISGIGTMYRLLAL